VLVPDWGREATQLRPDGAEASRPR
jgi:hypothetical protein